MGNESFAGPPGTTMHTPTTNPAEKNRPGFGLAISSCYSEFEPNYCWTYKLKKSKPQTMNTYPLLYVFPDNAYLTFRYKYDRDEKLKRHVTPRFLETAHYPKAKNKPVLNLYPKVKYHGYGMIAADFDKLPDGYDTFDSLFSDLNNQHKNRAWVFRSDSGKVKAIFQIETENLPSEWLALATLKSLLTEEQFEAIDKSQAAITACFLTPSLVREMERLPALKTVPTVWDDVPEATPYKTLEHTIPEEISNTFSTLKTRKNMSKVLQVIISMPELIDNYNLSQAKIALTTGLSQPTVSRTLKALIDLDLIDCIDSSWAVGVKAKTYKASGILLEFMIDLYLEEQKVPGPTTGHPLKLASIIPEGEWNKELGRLAFKFFQNGHALPTFLDYVSRIEGSDRKDRITQAKGWFKYITKNKTQSLVA